MDVAGWDVQAPGWAVGVRAQCDDPWVNLPLGIHAGQLFVQKVVYAADLIVGIQCSSRQKSAMCTGDHRSLWSRCSAYEKASIGGIMMVISWWPFMFCRLDVNPASSERSIVVPRNRPRADALVLMAVFLVC